MHPKLTSKNVLVVIDKRFADWDDALETAETWTGDGWECV